MDTKRARHLILDRIAVFGPLASMIVGTLLLGEVEAASFRVAALILWAPTPIGINALLAQGAEGGTRRPYPSLLSIVGWLGSLPYALG